uniref:Cna B-type domain-containing protein n=1 Tax=uncultured Faecalicoccus sp. TaxID=1971760 RepID=UPI002627A674
GFSTAVNDAIDYAYTSYTITDVIDPGFVLDEASITASEGTTYTVGTNGEGNQVITWTISNQPFKLVNLQYQLNLIPNQNGTYPIGQFDTNEGYATMTTGSTQVNQVQTPVLPRDGVNVTVDKKWEKDNESVRPDSIEVNLLKDGEVFDTVTIAEEDNWTYTWSDLDFINNWTVEEVAVADYNGKVDDKSQDALNKEYVITNTYTKEITPEKDPGQEDKPKEDEKSEGTKTATQTYIGLFSALASISLILVLLMAVLKKKMA